MQKKFDDDFSRRNLGSRIYMTRKGLKIGQVELGKMIGVTSGYISKIENGLVPVLPHMLNRIAKALHVSEWELTGERPPKELAAPAREEKKPAEEARLVPVLKKEMRRVPVIGFAQAAGFVPTIGSISSYLDEIGETEEWADAEEGCFLMRVEGRSMLPLLHPGSMLYVNTTKFPGRGDLVVAMLADLDLPIVKYYRRAKNIVYLESVNREEGQDYEISLEHQPGRLAWVFPVQEIKTKPPRRE